MTKVHHGRYADTLSFAGLREALEDDDDPRAVGHIFRQHDSGPLSDGGSKGVIGGCLPLEMPERGLFSRPSTHAPSSGSNTLFSPEGPEISSWYPHSPSEDTRAAELEGPESSWQNHQGVVSPILLEASVPKRVTHGSPAEPSRPKSSEPEFLDGSDVLQQISNLTSTQPSNEREVFVGGLRESDDAVHITEEELATYFAKFGVIESVSINRDDRTHRGRGFAFVKFFQESAALNAVVADASTHIIRGVTVSVQWSRGAKDSSGDRQRRRNSGNNSSNSGDGGSKGSSMYGFPAGQKRQRGGGRDKHIGDGVNSGSGGGGNGKGGMGGSSSRGGSDRFAVGAGAPGYGRDGGHGHAHRHSRGGHPNTQPSGGVHYGGGYNSRQPVTNTTVVSATAVQRGVAAGVPMVVIVPAQRAAALGLQAQHAHAVGRQRNILTRGGGEVSRGSPTGGELHFVPLAAPGHSGHSGHARHSPPPPSLSSQHMGTQDKFIQDKFAQAQDKYDPYSPPPPPPLRGYSGGGGRLPPSMPTAIPRPNHHRRIRDDPRNHPHSHSSPVHHSGGSEYEFIQDIVPPGLYSPPVHWGSDAGGICQGMGSPPGHRSPGEVQVGISRGGGGGAGGGSSGLGQSPGPVFSTHSSPTSPVIGSPPGYRAPMRGSRARDAYMVGLEGGGNNGGGLGSGGGLGGSLGNKMNLKHGVLHSMIHESNRAHCGNYSPEIHLNDYDFGFVGTSHMS